MKTDLELKKEVLVRLELDPKLTATGLEVGVKDGVVTLDGMLNTPQQRDATERAAKLVPGVKGVDDRIQVRASEGGLVSDAEITEEAKSAVKWLTTVPPESITVSVRKGWVNLSGTVESSHQRQTIEDVVRHLFHVKGVNNLIALKALPSGELAHPLTRAA